ncbi:MAG: hypothetical protein WDN25_08365 [Acetobacteraceae bacterium]
MIRKLGSIRLLPVTIFALASLLALKSAQFVRAATPAQEAAPKVAAPVSTAKAAERPPSPPAALPKAPEDTGPPPVTDAEKTVLLELRQRRQEMDTRETALATRESMLAAAEQRLAARVGELQVLQKQLETLDTARKEREDLGWQGLVKLYEAMKPRDAATIFNDLDMPVLLQVVDRMKEAKAAPVLAAMQPEKARDLTTKLAQRRTQRDGSAGG